MCNTQTHTSMCINKHLRAFFSSIIKHLLFQRKKFSPTYVRQNCRNHIKETKSGIENKLKRKIAKRKTFFFFFFLAFLINHL